MNIKKLYDRNRKSILRFIIIVAFIIIFIQILNYFAKKENIKNNDLQEKNETKVNISSGKTNVEDNKSSITGESISKDKLTTVSEVINKFVEYCNNGNNEKAYELLTTNCKEKLYPTIDIFENNYCNKTFSKEMVCEITNWVGDIYKIKLKEDPIATGVITEEYIEDYFTLQKENGQYKLNISNYIGRKEINKKVEEKDISITIESKDIFTDYEEYNIVVKNNSNNTIKMDSLDSTKTIYLQDNAGVKYYSYSHELLEENIIIKSKYTKRFSIKFAKVYSSGRNAQKIVFSNVILNYGEENLNKYIFQVNT